MPRPSESWTAPAGSSRVDGAVSETTGAQGVTATVVAGPGRRARASGRVDGWAVGVWVVAALLSLPVLTVSGRIFDRLENTQRHFSLNELVAGSDPYSYWMFSAPADARIDLFHASDSTPANNTGSVEVTLYRIDP